LSENIKEEREKRKTEREETGGKELSK